MGEPLRLMTVILVAEMQLGSLLYELRHLSAEVAYVALISIIRKAHLE